MMWNSCTKFIIHIAKFLFLVRFCNALLATLLNRLQYAIYQMNNNFKVYQCVKCHNFQLISVAREAFQSQAENMFL